MAEDIEARLLQEVKKQRDQISNLSEALLRVSQEKTYQVGDRVIAYNGDEF
jgi:hypothetical protein